MASAASNGRSADVLRLGDTVGERLDVEVNNKHLKAWVTTNNRYPASVAAQLDDARDRWLRKRERTWDGEPPPDLLEAARELAAEIENGVPGTAVLAPLLARITRAIRAYDEEPRYRWRAQDWEDFVTESLTILVPHLEDWEADLLPLDVRRQALVRLGWFSPDFAEASGETGGEGDSPPDRGPSSTGAEPEPTSAASTA